MAARPAQRVPVKAGTRKDPAPQPVIGFDPMKIVISNQDPDKTYILAYQAQIHGSGATYYEALGYDVELRREGGPMIMGAKCKMGEPIEYLGHVLMSVSNERRAEIELHGVGGGGGQLRADQVEDMMIDKRFQRDTFRGGMVERRFRNVGHGIQPTSYLGVSELDQESPFQE